ncbi:unnamed protein product [Kluyveromyces dobzhanskii CBS 2104]|uniref:WGS project CCBQ000000000 data, contig 00012 n=1 Tax=Kluyveromyces dobzhanskii CBS 2104 TaxID=1427455 RepID=A0A0A8L381_9SACH|nr:unnamed protein product [Kluyveromyces dobzhanskii CBS 2104]
MGRNESNCNLIDKMVKQADGGSSSTRYMTSRSTEGDGSSNDLDGQSVNSGPPGLKHSTVSFPENERITLKDTIPYYLPCFSWIPSYNSKKCLSDFVAGVSLASFQIPLAMSYATSVAHVPPLCGLYSLVFSPAVYTLLGSVPQMIVGPESAISLILGQAIEARLSEDPKLKAINLCLVVTFISGLVLLTGGLLRLGFLENVLSRALLRGFISGVGVVMVITSLVVELKLNHVTPTKQEHYHSPFEKVLFIIKYGPENYHRPTAILSLSAFVILMSLRIFKKRLGSRFKWLILLPDILIVVALSIIISYKMHLKSKYGIEIIDDIPKASFKHLKNPLSGINLRHFKELFSTGFMVAMLGFFESTTASKSLGTSYNLAISSNRELIALGSMNVVGSMFAILPAFGGYGRSKINAYSGARTTMSGFFMGFVTLFTIQFFLPVIRYIPVCVLSVITTVVGLTLLEEAPHDLKFHWRCKGYSELTIFTVTLLATLFYSLEAGIYIGCACSIINVVKHSAKSRIQILGRVPGSETFINADDFQANAAGYSVNPQLEEIEGCLIVKVAEPLTFTNADDLKMRLHRLEKHGSAITHPAAPRSRKKEMTENVIFDLKGMTDIDSSAAQTLGEILSAYNQRKVHIFLANVPLSEKIRERLVNSGVTELCEKNALTSSCYFSSIEEALTISDAFMQRQNGRYSSPPPSIFSNTLLNSSLV